MKKLLLLGAIVLASFSAEAQNLGQSCAQATPVTTNGTITAASFNGTFQTGLCLGSRTGIKAKWYRYDATANGEVTISSNLPDNNGGPTYTNDTRVQILVGTGACVYEDCVATGDDISATNYLTTVTFPVQSGKSYFIQWDNYWNGTSTIGFKWTFNFTAVSCVRPGVYGTYLPDSYTTTGATLYWDNAIGSPASYDVDYSTNLTAAAGTGTIVPATAVLQDYSTVTINGLAPSSNFRYYIRSNCGFTQSGWQGPYFGYLAKAGSFNHDFNTAADPEDGFVGDFILFEPGPTNALLSYADGSTGGSVYTFNSGTAASDEWAFTRGVALTAGQVVSIKYKTRLYAAPSETVPNPVPAPMSLRVTAGTEQVDDAQINILQTINPTGAAAFTQQQTPNWTVPADGVYFFGFNNNSAQNAQATAIFLDTIEITVTGTAGTNDVIASKFSVFPNPATNVITVSGTEALVNGVEVIDLNGRTVKTVKVNGVAETQINISDLSAGVYMMNISSDKGVATKKIVKQ